MSNKKFYLLFILVIIAVLAAGIFDFPGYYNTAAKYLSPKLHFTIPNMPDKMPFKLGLDLQGGVHLIYEADLSGVEVKDKPEAMAGLRDLLEKRVNYFGVKEPTIQVVESGGGYRIIVELAGVIDPAQAVEMIGKTPYLEFRELRAEDEVNKIQAKREELQGKTPEEYQKIENWQLAFEDIFQSTALTGRYLKQAVVDFGQTASEPLVALQFDDEGAKIFEELTGRNVGKQLAIYIDNELISAPVVREKISGGKAQITGNFTVDEARNLARNLSAGALPVPIKLISEQQVGPTLGAASLKASFKAGFWAFLAIMVFMVVLYRLPGLLSAIALFSYFVFTLAIFKLFGVTITLAGIGGLILSIGMAVDANILIYARLRDELMSGGSVVNVLRGAFVRAWPAVRDGNATTILIGIILFSFGTSFVKGFALTLILGNIISVLSAFLVTRIFMEFFANTKLGKISFLWSNFG